MATCYVLSCPTLMYLQPLNCSIGRYPVTYVGEFGGLFAYFSRWLSALRILGTTTVQREKRGKK